MAEPDGAAVSACSIVRDGQEAHESAGADWGVTDTRLTIGPDGVSVASLRTWLDPDLLPLLSAQAGPDLWKSAAEVAFQSLPSAA